MNDTTELTISIVGYMDYEDMVRAVKSIEQFTDHAIKKQIYLVDNGARYDPCYVENKGRYENTGHIVEREESEVHEELRALSDCYSDVRCINTPCNVGFGSGHNMAIKKINSSYHAIVNPDILITEDVFSPMINYMEKHPGTVMLSPRLVGTDGELLHVYRREPTVFDCFIRRFVPFGFKKRAAYHTMQDADYESVFDVEFAQGSFMLVRTDVLKQLKGFDERYFMYMEDADLCRRLREKGRIQYFPGATVIHKWERGSRKNMKLFMTHLSSMFRYFRKWGFKWI